MTSSRARARLERLSSAHTGDVCVLPTDDNRPGEVMVILVAETPQFLGSGLLVRPPGAPTSLDDRVHLAQRLGKILKESTGASLSPVPAYAPAIVHPYTGQAYGMEFNQLVVPVSGGALVHFAAGPPERGRFQ